MKQCEGCNRTINNHDYGRNAAGSIFCYDCCGILDKEQMDTAGEITLYLQIDQERYGGYRKAIGAGFKGRVTNWPGTLCFPCYVSKGRHNMAGTQYNVAFRDHNGNHWHGRAYGESSELCRCRKIKQLGKQVTA